MPIEHEHDLDFIRRVREASRDGLDTLLQWQCQEAWRRAAVLREIARRDGTPMPITA